MKLGIMQPYFVPYIGYWQLLHSVDRYVIYDDVNFITGGWINRNRILIHGAPHYFNLPMRNASQNRLIREVGVDPNPALRRKMLATLDACYKKAPYYRQAMEVLAPMIQCREETVSGYLANSLHMICQYLGITTELTLSSDIPKQNALKGQDKILHICQLLQADTYHNAIGGQALYDSHAFSEAGIALRFLKPEPVVYRQFGGEFVPNLSIIDLMMFNDLAAIRQMLEAYTLV